MSDETTTPTQPVAAVPAADPVPAVAPAAVVPAVEAAPAVESAPAVAPVPVPAAPEAVPAAPVEAAAPAPVADPVATPAVAPVPAAEPTAAPAAPAEGKKKILVVEDEQDARAMFVDLLESEDFDVSSGVDGIDALAKAAAEKFDLILLDIVMPNMDGVEVLQQIKKDPAKYGTPIVVMLTNISGDAAIEKAMELGAAGYRLKIGTEPEKLLQDVKDFLAGKVQDVKAEPVTSSLT